MPVLGDTVLHMPCSFLNIEKTYGWYWNKQDKQQQFFPGISLRVKENTLVNPILDGQVMEIKRDETSGTVLVKHNKDFYSVYGGLKEVLVEMNDDLKTSTALGKTGETFYFEVRTGEGPVDPHSIFH
jgi:murein DD-endopeptidase MepM/ murein hydrolase activator NlpD